MASRAAKEVPVREKRGKSPSPSNLRNTDPAQCRRSPHPPSLDHHHHQKPISASDHKINAPNYLRPTISSRTDTSKNNSATKKPSTTTSTTNTAHKSTINQRKCLDNKPLPGPPGKLGQSQALRSEASNKSPSRSSSSGSNDQSLARSGGLSSSLSTSTSTSHSTTIAIIAGVGVAVALLIVALAVLCVVCTKRKKRKHYYRDVEKRV